MSSEDDTDGYLSAASGDDDDLDTMLDGLADELLDEQQRHRRVLSRALSCRLTIDRPACILRRCGSGEPLAQPRRGRAVGVAPCSLYGLVVEPSLQPPC